METHERLYRSQTEKVIGGVAGGLADYFDIDVVLARVVFVLLALFGGGGVLIYIVLWIVIPSQPLIFSANSKNRTKEEVFGTGNNDNTESDSNSLFDTKPAKQSNTALIAGVSLILVGMLFLGDRLFPWYNIADLWPLLLVGVGIIMIKPDILKSSKKQSNEI